jgi:hypothetical protein
MSYKNKEKGIEYRKKYREENIIKIKEYQRLYKEKNKEKLKLYRQQHPEIGRAWRVKNHDRCIATSRKWRKNNLGKDRDSTFKRKFGISLEQYNSMLSIQKGVCAICLRPERRVYNGKISQLAVDHNHLTGKIRGLLCNDCNVMLGNAKDDPEILKRAIVYLERQNVVDNN